MGGDTVNVGARLQAHVGIGDPVVSELTARQLGEVFELDQLGELELTGRWSASQPSVSSRSASR